VALLPDHVCGDDLRAGRLVRVLPGWGGQMGIVHLVFTTRHALPPGVRDVHRSCGEDVRGGEAEA
jgi:DNA-binding transcriptional LysR family regulator